MRKWVMLLLAALALCTSAEAQRRTRIVRPLKKIHTDTIAIPDDMLFHTEEPEPSAPPVAPTEEAPAKKKKGKSKDSTAKKTSNESLGVRTPIVGESQIDADRMYRFVAARNPDFPREIAEAFFKIGRRYGIRGDIALCQAILETGWFLFTGGTAVTLSQNNFCGLGVTQLGLKGHSFPTVEEGVTAQIQHLYAYACTDPLPKGEKLVDPRFSRVMRGVAPTWADLNRRWAANDHYADRIMGIYADLEAFDPD